MIAVYNTDLQRIGTIVQYTSAQWTKKFYDTGSFEIHIPHTAEGLIHLEIYNIIHANDNWGYILKRQWNEKEVVIYGYDLCGILEYRSIFSTRSDGVYSINGLISTAGVPVSNVITQPGISLKEYRYYPEDSIVTNVIKGYNAAELIREAALQEEVGYDIYISSKGLCSEIKKGAHREYIVFSVDRGNIIEFAYEEDYFKNYNKCYYFRYTDSMQNEATFGTYVSSTTKLTEIQEICDNDFKKTWWDSDRVTQEVKAFVNKNNNISKSITFMPSRYIYKQDYFLGDYVTTKVDVFGKTLCETKQITEVNEVFESAKHEVKLTLGAAKKNYIRVLKNKGVI